MRKPQPYNNYQNHNPNHAADALTGHQTHNTYGRVNTYQGGKGDYGKAQSHQQPNYNRSDAYQPTHQPREAEGDRGTNLNYKQH